MFSSIPNDFFSEENMNKYSSSYRNSAAAWSTNPPDVAASPAPGYQAYNTDQYQYQQAFDIEELRTAFPDANQEKQAIEINLATGVAIVSKLKLINGQYVENSVKDNIDASVILTDIQKFESKGFRVYRVSNSNQVLYLTKFSVL